MLAKEVFILEDERSPIVYLPLKGIVFRITKSKESVMKKLILDPKSCLEDFAELFPGINRQILFKPSGNEYIRSFPKAFPPKPTSVVLFPTFDCNLRCIYCYSKGGEIKGDLSWDIAKSAIDFVIQNAINCGKKTIKLEFHGGGEPTRNWSLLVNARNYFVKKAKKCNLSSITKIMTNGFLSEYQAKWIAENVDRIGLSFDGIEDIQDVQRPTATGNSSFLTVERTASVFEKRGIKFTIRATLTSIGIDKLPETINYFCEKFPHANIAIEPVCGCRRKEILKWGELKPNDFVNFFIEGEEIAEHFGKKIRYSSSDLSLLRYNFCGVSKPNFVVAPFGFVSACYEVSENSHKLADIFVYGQYSNGKFIFDKEKIHNLREYAKRPPECQNCYAQYQCAGECLAKNIQSDREILPYRNLRCEITKELIKRHLIKVVSL